MTDSSSSIGAFAIRQRLAIIFITVAVCLGGVYSALRMPSSVFPETEFPRCVILIDSGVMPADEMLATITRPIEEAMKDIPGVVQVRSATGRGSAEVNVFFNWKVNMVESELYVLSRVSQLKSSLPANAKTTVWRLTFNAFPIIGVSLTSPKRELTELWERARYDLKPRFLRIPGIARGDLVGGRAPEYHVIVDPLKLAAAQTFNAGRRNLMHVCRQSLVAAGAIFLIGSILAQERPHPPSREGDPLSLIRVALEPAVQRELNLDEDQLPQVLQSVMPAELAGRVDAAALREVKFTEQQLKTLKNALEKSLMPEQIRKEFQ